MPTNNSGENYAVFKGGQLTELYCKECGEQIAGMVDISVENSKKIDGTLVQVVRQGFAHYDNHAELTLEMHNGDKHVTCVCRSCADKSIQEHHERWHSIDVKVFEKVGSHPSFISHCRRRTVVGRLQ